MYNKLFTKILDSSIWLEPTTTRIVWITLLAAMDEDGYAHFSAIENLALRARITVEECNAAVTVLSSPDQNSADPSNEGRRIERVPGGFIVLNAEKYRLNFNALTRREQTRLRVKKHREKKEHRPLVTHGNDVTKNVTPPMSMSMSTRDRESAERERGDSDVKVAVKAEDIYAAYPLKVAKGEALKAIGKALKIIPAEDLLLKTRKFAEARNGDMNFCPHPSTWFGQGRYSDDPSTWKPNHHTNGKPPTPKPDHSKGF